MALLSFVTLIDTALPVIGFTELALLSSKWKTDSFPWQQWNGAMIWPHKIVGDIILVSDAVVCAYFVYLLIGRKMGQKKHFNNEIIAAENTLSSNKVHCHFSGSTC